MKKKICMAAVFAAIALAGCAGGNAENTVKDGGEQDERMRITLAIWDADRDLAGDAVLDAVEERFGIELVPVNMTWNEYYQKVTRWAATDSLPDLFVGDFRNAPEYAEWVDRGLLCPIPEDLSAYPYLEQYMEELGEIQMPLVDGRAYCIPRKTYPSQEWTCMDRIIAYRWDLAQQAGITKEPENWEEFQEMILAIIRADPEGKGIRGMTAENAGVLSGMLLPYASSTAVSGGNNFYWKKDRDGIYRPVYFADDLTCAFRLGRDMYDSGVIEKEILMQTANGAREKFLLGENAAICFSGGFGNIYDRVGAYWEEQYGRDYFEDVKALRLMPDVNGNKAYPVWGYAWSESYISSGVSEEKLDKILQLYDYLLSDEGALFTNCGSEGDPHMYPSCNLFSVLVRWDPSLYDERFPLKVPEECIRVNRELQQEAQAVQIPEYEPECNAVMREEQIAFSLDVGNDFLRIMTGAEPVEEIWGQIKGEYEEKGLQEMIDRVNVGMERRRME